MEDNTIWIVMVDHEELVDDFASSSFEQAKQDALNVLIKWSAEEIAAWDPSGPTREQIEKWNRMLCECSVSVSRYNFDTEEYDMYWEPSNEDLESIGWAYIKESEVE